MLSVIQLQTEEMRFRMIDIEHQENNDLIFMCKIMLFV